MEANDEISLSEPENSEEPSEDKPEITKENGDVKEPADNSELLEKLKNFETTISHLKEEVLRKTDVINNLEKQKGAFEKEVTHVSSPWKLK